MAWDGDDVLTVSQEAVLQAAEQAYAERQRRSGGTTGVQGTSASLSAATSTGAGPYNLEAPTESSFNKPAAGPLRRRRLPHLHVSATGTPGSAPPAAEGAPRASDENLPPACFTGRLHYAYTALEVDRCCRWVLEEGGVAVLGFDIEWRVTYEAGVAPRPAALIQLCFLQQAAASGVGRPNKQAQGPRHSCLLLHICHSGLTPHLRQLLRSEHILKVGVGVHGDAQKLHRDFGVELGGVLCLSQYANQRLVGAAPAADGGASAADGPPQAPPLLPAPQKWSLAGLVGQLLRLRLKKSQAVRCSNWEAAPPLSAEQQRYAATDAWASLRVHEVLSALPVLAPSPPPPAASAAPAVPLAAAGQPAVVLDPVALDWVPALPALRHLQPAKQAVYAALHQGLSVGQVAAQRRIREDSVLGYLAEAVTAGMGYSAAALGLPPGVLQQVAHVCGELLGRQLRWRPEAAAEQDQQPGEQQRAGERCQAGRKRPPPCSPSTLAAAASAPACDVGSEAVPPAGASSMQETGLLTASSRPAPAAGACKDADVLERLVAAGHSLRQLKEDRFPDVSYGHLRLALAHLSRCNPPPWT